VSESDSFLRDKIGHLSFGAILYSQVEAFALWLVGGIPGVPGFALRTLVGKLLFKRLGGFAWIQPGVTFVQTDRLSVGSHFGINTGSYLNAIGGLTLGDYVLIGSNVTISSGQHPVDGRLPPVFARPVVPKPIVIEDDVWIGAGAVIMPGITLRTGTVVGANAVVTKDTEPYAVVVGAPARTIRFRTS
jgi:acetyltransferase-like isoleucine patch superfamily enzyme